MRDRDLVAGDDGDRLPGKRHRGHSIPGAMIAGAVNLGLAGLAVWITDAGLPFIGPLWAAVLPALLAERAAAALDAFLLVGSPGNFAKSLGGLLRHGTGAWACYLLWKQYPFLFSAVGAPGWIDHYLPWFFALACLIHGISALAGLFRMFRGNRRDREERDHP